MFEIHPAAANKADVLAAREGIAAPVEAMILSEGSEESGYLLYRLENNTAILLVCRCVDADLQEWLVRAALNAAANRNAIEAICKEPSLFNLLERCGFSLENGQALVFIPDFFNRPCQGCGGCL